MLFSFIDTGHHSPEPPMSPRERGPNVCLTLVLLALGACSNNSTNGPVPTYLVISPDSIGLFRGDSAQVATSVLDKDSTPITGTTVTFSSSDPTIAHVTASGWIISTGPAGKVTVQASAGKLHKNLPVTV